MMAKKKKPGVNKSDLIRNYMEAHPDDKPAQIVAALKSQGVTVGLVNAVRAKEKAKGKTKAKIKAKAASKTTKASSAPNNGHASELLHSALTLGLDKAIELLQKVKKAVG